MYAPPRYVLQKLPHVYPTHNIEVAAGHGYREACVPPRQAFQLAGGTRTLSNCLNMGSQRANTRRKMDLEGKKHAAHIAKTIMQNPRLI